MKTFYNLVVIEGPPDAVKLVLDDLITHFPSAVKECAKEAQRHRDWFKKEGIGFCQPLVSGHVISAHSFETEPGDDSKSLPPNMEVVRGMMQHHKNKVRIGYAAIDRQNVQWAVALAACTDSDRGIVGCLGGDRYSYFRLMKHLLHKDDTATWFRECTSNRAIGPIPYKHRAQWSESTSPLRLEFRTEDPARDGWGLTQGLDSNARTFISKDGFLPAAGVSVSVPVNWVTAIKLLLRAVDCEIYPCIDHDGQLMLSGYAVHRAGLIDPTLTPTFELSPADVVEFGLGDPPSPHSAMVAVLKLYLGCLSEARDNFAKQPGTTELLLRIDDHMQSVLRWLADKGYVKLTIFGKPSTSVN